jgi:putative membrane protein
VLTYGLFIFILNGIIFYWAAGLIKDVKVEDIWSGTLGWIIYSVLSLFFNSLFII